MAKVITTELNWMIIAHVSLAKDMKVRDCTGLSNHAGMFTKKGDTDENVEMKTSAKPQYRSKRPGYVHDQSV
jgi:hypothetical protein